MTREGKAPKIKVKNQFLGGSKGNKDVYFDHEDEELLCPNNNNQLQYSIFEEKKNKGSETTFNDQSENKNQLALLRDIEIEKNLEKKVKSMYCNDYLSSEKNNPEIFKKLMNQVTYITII